MVYDVEVTWALKALEAVNILARSEQDIVMIPGYGRVDGLTREDQDAITDRIEKAARLLLDQANVAFHTIHALRGDDSIPY